VLLLTLRGTPTLYYGDELGLSDVAIEPSKVRDPRELREPGLGLGRDPMRTPMPWDASENAGFTTAKPWLPLNADWPTRNVARMTEESQSILTLYRRLLALRRDCLALSIGDFVLLNVEDEILAYERRYDAERLIVALNLGDSRTDCSCRIWARDSRLLLSTARIRRRSKAAPSCYGRMRLSCSRLGGTKQRRDDRLRIAMLAPISWRTPPRHYGPWEQVTSLLTEALVARGVDVTLFATKDSRTSARLDGICPAPYSEDPLG